MVFMRIYKPKVQNVKKLEIYLNKIDNAEQKNIGFSKYRKHTSERFTNNK